MREKEGIVKPIETLYKGYRFRSRLEARWAVFFDALGVTYEYEKEGYRFGRIWYLPDFWLPDQGCWVEIKGQEPNEEEKHLAGLLAKGTKKDVYLFSGPIPLPEHYYDDGYAEAYFWSDEVENGIAHDSPYWWCECPVCGLVGICFSGWASRLPCQHGGINDIPTLATPRLLSAYTAARSARFARE